MIGQEWGNSILAPIGLSLVGLGVVGIVFGLIKLAEALRCADDRPQWTENGVDSQKQIDAELAAPVPNSDDLRCILPTIFIPSHRGGFPF